MSRRARPRGVVLTPVPQPAQRMRVVAPTSAHAHVVVAPPGAVAHPPRPPPPKRAVRSRGGSPRDRARAPSASAQKRRAANAASCGRISWQCLTTIVPSRVAAPTSRTQGHSHEKRVREAGAPPGARVCAPQRLCTRPPTHGSGRARTPRHSRLLSGPWRCVGHVQGIGCSIPPQPPPSTRGRLPRRCGGYVPPTR